MNYLVLSSLVKQTIRELDLVSKIVRYDTTWESLETVEGYEKPPKEEFEAKLQELIDAQPLKELRTKRNKLLTECDWVATRAFTTDTPVPDEWKTYMQALRDLPTATEDPSKTVWPVAPTS